MLRKNKQLKHRITNKSPFQRVQCIHSLTSPQQKEYCTGRKQILSTSFSQPLTSFPLLSQKPKGCPKTGSTKGNTGPVADLVLLYGTHRDLPQERVKASLCYAAPLSLHNPVFEGFGIKLSPCQHRLPQSPLQLQQDHKTK